MSKIISGHIDEDGSIVSGSKNFKATANGGGSYDVTFTEPFTTYANIVLTAVVPQICSAYVGFLSKPSTSGFHVSMEDLGNAGSGQSGFNFIAVGD
jgi:hypothetical protein